MKHASDGGEAIVEAFRKLEVDYILSSPGTEWAPVWEAMANQIKEGKNGPRLLDCWHETLAVDIAAGYTLATGRMQGVLLHAGSGLLQGAMGIHAAWIAGVPMVVISGETTTYGEQPASIRARNGSTISASRAAPRGWWNRWSNTPPTPVAPIRSMKA